MPLRRGEEEKRENTGLIGNFGLALLLLAFQGMLILCPDADAQIFNVSNASDFRAALDQAAANNSDDTIILAAGTYSTTGGGFFRFLSLNGYNLTIQAAPGLLANDVILNGALTDQVLNYNNAQPSTLTLDRLSIKNGNAAGNGGGVAVNGDLTVKGCIVSGNTATNYDSGYGGGIYSTGNVSLSKSTISGNKAAASVYGAGIYGGGIYAGGSITVADSTISGNTLSGAGGSVKNPTYGGGVYSSSSVNVTRSSLSVNSADTTGSDSYGGGIYAGGSVTVTDTTISGNTSAGALAFGGGIYSSNSINVANSIISQNKATADYYGSQLSLSGSGGGIYGGSVVINSSSLVGNTTSVSATAKGSNGVGSSSSSGGAIYSAGFTTLTNSVLSGNSVSSTTSALGSGSSSSLGGALYSTNGATVINSTLSGNTTAASGTGSVSVSNSGGGIYGSGIFMNNIFESNSTDIYFTGLSFLYYNFVDTGKLQNWVSTALTLGITPPGAGSLNYADAGLRLGAGSVAINKGTNPDSADFLYPFAHAVIDPGTLQTVLAALATDKDGNPRVTDAVIDLGAHEYSSANMSIYLGGTGSGRVVSHPGRINCDGLVYTDCLAFFPMNTLVSLDTIPAAGGSIFAGWDVNSACANGQLTVSSPTSCTATFDSCSPTSIVKLNGGLVIDSIRHTYDYAYSISTFLPPDTIHSFQIIASNQQEILDFNLGLIIELDGGHNCSFTLMPSSGTTITGSLTVTSGVIIVNNIRIQ